MDERREEREELAELARDDADDAREQEAERFYWQNNITWTPAEWTWHD